MHKYSCKHPDYPRWERQSVKKHSDKVLIRLICIMLAFFVWAIIYSAMTYGAGGVL